MNQQKTETKLIHKILKTASLSLTVLAILATSKKEDHEPVLRLPTEISNTAIIGSNGENSYLARHGENIYIGTPDTIPDSETIVGPTYINVSDPVGVTKSCPDESSIQAYTNDAHPQFLESGSNGSQLLSGKSPFLYIPYSNALSNLLRDSNNTIAISWRVTGNLGYQYVCTELKFEDEPSTPKPMAVTEIIVWDEDSTYKDPNRPYDLYNGIGIKLTKEVFPTGTDAHTFFKVTDSNGSPMDLYWTYTQNHNFIIGYSSTSLKGKTLTISKDLRSADEVISSNIPASDDITIIIE